MEFLTPRRIRTRWDRFVIVRSIYYCSLLTSTYIENVYNCFLGFGFLPSAKIFINLLSAPGSRFTLRSLKPPLGHLSGKWIHSCYTCRAFLTQLTAANMDFSTKNYVPSLRAGTRRRLLITIRNYLAQIRSVSILQYIIWPGKLNHNHHMTKISKIFLINKSVRRVIIRQGCVMLWVRTIILLLYDKLSK